MGFGSMAKPIIVKKSPVVIVKNFLILQSCAVIVFFFVSTLAYYSKIYRTLAISHLISFHVAEALFLFSAETTLVFFIFFRWYKESYHICDNEIIHAKGIVFRQRTVIPLEDMVSVSYSQGPLAKLTRYGTIELKNNQNRNRIQLKDIPEPHDHVDLIIKFKRLSQDNKSTLVAEQPNIVELLSNGEHENLEFKSTFRWDMRQNAINRNLEKTVMKTIAAFMNSQGGHLVIGVDDSRAVVGLAADYGSLNKKDADGFENHFTHVFQSMIGAEFRQFVKLNWQKVNGVECCVISVVPSYKPVYLKENNAEEFYIRTGNGTTPLKLSEISSYIDSRWKRI